MKDLAITIESILSDQGADFDPSVLVVTAAADATSAALYRQSRGKPGGCQAGVKMLAIVSTRVLNSPDQIMATGSRRDSRNFEMRVEIRSFKGSLRGNDPWLALIRMDLGTLEPGAYELLLKQIELDFSDLQHPERATNPVASEQRWSFTCA